MTEKSKLETLNAYKRISASPVYYQKLVDEASCGIVLATKEGLILDLNRKGEDLFSCSREEVIGKDFGEFIVSADKAYITAQLQLLVRQGVINAGEIRIKSNSNRPRLLEFSGKMINIADEEVIMIVAEDVTALSQFRAQAILNDRLAAMSILAGGVAHVINNPNSWVLANLIFLKDHLNFFTETIDNLEQLMQEPEGNKKQIREWITNFKKMKLVSEYDEVVTESIQGSERIRDAIQSLQEFANTAEIETSAVDIHDLLNAVVNMILPELKSTHHLEKDYFHTVPKIRGNIGKLHQAFLNLILNAVKATSESHYKNTKIRIATKQEGKFVRIDVSYTGDNIPQEVLPRIFDPFFTVNPIGQGADLGLTISHEIIRNSGGRITVESKPAEDTIFSVYLPIYEEGEQSIVENTLELEEAPLRKRLLIVDDEPSILKSLQRMLEDYHEVTVALGGRIALEQLNRPYAKFDAIIADLIMPDIDGVKLYLHIAENYPGLEDHIIFITGGAYTPTLKQFLSGVSNPCLLKPFNKEDILQSIQERAL